MIMRYKWRFLLWYVEAFSKIIKYISDPQYLTYFEARGLIWKKEPKLQNRYWFDLISSFMCSKNVTENSCEYLWREVDLKYFALL